MKAGGGHANSQVEVDLGPKFVYKHLGSMATVGRYKALVDLRQSKVGCSSVLCESLQFTRRPGVELSDFFPIHRARRAYPSQDLQAGSSGARHT